MLFKNLKRCSQNSKRVLLLMISEANKRDILSYIKQYTPVSSGEIATALKIDKSTVSRHLRSLEKHNLIKPVGTKGAAKRKGRRPLLWSVNPEGAFFIGADIDAGGLRLVVMDLCGQVIARKLVETPGAAQPAEILDMLAEETRGMIDNMGTAARVFAMGVCVPGSVDRNTGIVTQVDTLSGWKEVYINIKECLESALDIPVRVEHDIRAMALGELLFDNERCHSHFICLGLRAGIGMAIVANGMVCRGANRMAGEIGHVMVEPDGPLCTCGKCGCLEVMAGELAIIRAVTSQERSICGRDDETSLTKVELYKRLRLGDPIIEKVVGRSGYYIGRQLAYATILLDPEVIVLAGGILEVSNIMEKAIVDNLQAHLAPSSFTTPPVFTAKFGAWAFAVGAAALWYDTFYKPVWDLG